MSANYTVGDYHYQIEIERDSDNNRIIVDRGQIKVSTDYDNNVDPRHHAEIMLGKIETILEGKADSDVSSYSINGRSLNKSSRHPNFWSGAIITGAEVNEIKKQRTHHARAQNKINHFGKVLKRWAFLIF